MSALEQIRKRPGLIISILGLALVLFIFTMTGDNLWSSFEDTTTIAKVNGQKISHPEFQKRETDMRNQYESRNMKVDNATIEENAIESLIMERLMNASIADAGITVTGDELGKAMLGDNIPMSVQQLYWQRQQAGLPAGRELYDIVKNPAQYQLDPETAQTMTESWIELEEQVSQMLSQQKYQNLLLGALPVNDLDAMAQYDDNNNSTEIRYAKVDAMTVSDSDVEVSDADLKAQYDKDKNLYKLDEDAYVVNYIVTDVVPSDRDRLEATRAVEDALMNLRTMPGTEAVAGNNKFVITRYNTAAKYLPATLSARLDSLAKDSVQQISFYDNKYTLAKFNGKNLVADSVTVDLLALAPTVDADSIIGLLNNGTTIAALGDSIVLQAQEGQRASLLNGNSEIALIFNSAEEGKYFNAPDFTQGDPHYVFRLARKDAPVVAYNIAEITYQLEPSTTTINDTQSKLRAYVTENNDAKKFVENAIAAGYTALPATVTKGSLSVGSIADSRGLAKWAVKADKGDVSEVYGDDDKAHFFAAVLTNVYDGGYTPLNDPVVEAQVRAKVTRAKKNEKILADYQGKGTSVDTYAQAMNAKVDTTTVTFGQNYTRGFMPGDGKLIAIATDAKPGEFKGPVATDFSVVVFEVISEKAPEREFDAVNDASYFEQTMGAQSLLRNFPMILRANADVDNRIQKFFQD